MALNFGSKLFTGNDDDLKSRWQQSGSSPVSVSGGSGTFYTVTSGKVLNITGMTYYSRDTAGEDIVLKDGGSGGTSKFRGNAAVNNVLYVAEFSTPLQFATDIYIDDGAGNMIINMTGWEE